MKAFFFIFFFKHDVKLKFGIMLAKILITL